MPGRRNRHGTMSRGPEDPAFRPDGRTPRPPDRGDDPVRPIDQPSPLQPSRTSIEQVHPAREFFDSMPDPYGTTFSITAVVPRATLLGETAGTEEGLVDDQAL